mgnify:CR=1 FL=1
MAIVFRQRELHTVLLAVAPLAWLAGSVLFLVHRADAAPAWWFAFLVITIAAERLEMTRLRPRRAWAPPLLIGNRLTDQRKDEIGEGAMFFSRPQRQFAPHFRGQPECNPLR